MVESEEEIEGGHLMRKLAEESSSDDQAMEEYDESSEQ